MKEVNRTAYSVCDIVGGLLNSLAFLKIQITSAKTKYLWSFHIADYVNKVV